MEEKDCDGCVLKLIKGPCSLFDVDIECPCSICLVKMMCRVDCEIFKRHKLIMNIKKGKRT